MDRAVDEGNSGEAIFVRHSVWLFGNRGILGATPNENKIGGVAVHIGVVNAHFENNNLLMPLQFERIYIDEKNIQSCFWPSDGSLDIFGAREEFFG